MSQNPLVGKTLRHHYRILQELGSGGFGDTYLAQDLDLPGQPYRVVKHLKPKSNDPAVLPIAKTLFEREAQTLDRLGNQSDRIPKLFAHFEEHGEFYLVQEFIDGHDLTKEIIPGQSKGEKVVIKLLQDILEVLAVVHQHQVIHRDIKPQNLMRRKADGKIVLIDFGAVKEISTLLVNPQGQTSVSVAIGSPGYMPSEQARGKPKYASDVYAVGMMAIQALTGLMANELKEDPQTGEILWRDRAQVSDELAEVLDKMVRDHFSQRYQTAAEAMQALMPIAAPMLPPTLAVSSIATQSTPPQSPTASSIPTIPSPPPATIPSVPPTSKGTTPPPTRRKVLTLLSLAGVGLGGVAVWELLKRTLLQSSPQSSPSPSSRPVASASPVDSNSPVSVSANNLKSFSFEVVKVNDRGQVTSTTQKTARSFAQDLGNGVTLEMVAIPGGTFTMGSPTTEEERESHEGPQHQVTVKPFYLGKFEVTQAQYQAIMGNNPSSFKGANLPVEQVSWNDAVKFCQRLSQKTGRTYRLPSEAEWEYAARAGTSTAFCFGETITTDLANYNGSSSYGSAPKGQNRQETTDVGSFPPNNFGLYDLHGNVWEWCQDTFQENYNGAPADGSARTDKNGDRSPTVLRGGSWYDGSEDSRSAARYGDNPDKRDDDFGFRVAVSASTSDPTP
jgi:formylglycine-generating enzyme required for sulfatase activity